MRIRAWALLSILSTFLLMVVGAYVVKTNAGLSCPSWPDCTPGDYFPPFENPPYTQEQILSEWFHRLLAMIASVFTVGLAVVTFRHYKFREDLKTLAVAALGLLFAQVLAGALTVMLGNAPWTVVIHQGLAITFFGVLVAILARTWNTLSPHPYQPEAAPALPVASEKRTRIQVLADYMMLLKPRVLLLLLVA